MARAYDYESERCFAYVKTKGLRHFKPAEVLYKGTSHGNPVLNTLPPEQIWPNCIPVLWVIDLAREALGHPLSILSGYRSPQYNDAVSGARHSLHLEWRAYHLAPTSGSQLVQYQLLSILRDFRQAGVFRGGIGVYDDFIHVDTRGHNVDW